MKVLLLQQPKSFSNYPKWIEEIQERFDCLEVMVFTSNDRAAHHSWPSSVIKEIEVSDYSSDSATAKFFDIVRKFKPDRIVSSSEEDVLRVAEARSLFGIPGLQHELALSCRDKVTMKQSALDAGLKIIPYTTCQALEILFRRSIVGRRLFSNLDGAQGLQALRYCIRKMTCPL